MEKVEAESPAAADLLRLCAFLAPEDIPSDLISAAAERVPEPLASTLQDPLLRGRAIAALRRYSLLDTTANAWAIHRLVGDVVRFQLDNTLQQQWAQTALTIVYIAFPSETQDDLDA